jgi:predicted transcriptional regulator
MYENSDDSPFIGTNKEIAEMFNISKKLVELSLKNLEKAGLIERMKVQGKAHKREIRVVDEEFDRVQEEFLYKRSDEYKEFMKKQISEMIEKS